MLLRLVTCTALAASLSACEKSPPTKPPQTTASAERSEGAVTPDESGGTRYGLRGSPDRAELGKRAPDFVLPALDGAPLELSDHAGKRIVLEWFNPECPFVNLAHTKGSLKDTAERHRANGVVWIAVNSNAPGKQGHDVEKNRAAKERFGMDHPIVRDETGEVGKAYGAVRTPHLFVIDEAFTLVYAGAIDNSPDAEGESPTGGTLENYVDATLEDLAQERPVATPRTEAYGCTVKYAD